VNRESRKTDGLHVGLFISKVLLRERGEAAHNL
jgi:hypothetical protein